MPHCVNLVAVFLAPCKHLDLCRQLSRVNSQRMVTHYFQWRRDSIEQVSPLVKNSRRLAVHELRCAYNPAAVGFRDGLMSKADSKYWNFCAKITYHIDADSGVTRNPWPWRDDYCRWAQ